MVLGIVGVVFAFGRICLSDGCGSFARVGSCVGCSYVVVWFVVSCVAEGAVSFFSLY